MKPSGQKILFIFTLVLSIAVLLGTGLAYKTRLLELWYLSRLDSPADEVRSRAATELGKMRSRDAIAPLITLLQSVSRDADLSDLESNDLHFSAKALIAIGEPSVPALCRLLDDENPGHRLQAARIIRKLGARAASAAPHLGSRLLDPSPPVQRMAILALAEIGPPASVAVPDLLDLLSDPRGRDWTHFTCRALQRIGLQPEAVPALCKALKHMDHHNWEMPRNSASTNDNVVDLLGNLGPAAKDSIPALAQCLEERKSIVLILRALGNMGPASKAALPGLLKAIEHAGVEEFSSSTSRDEYSTRCLKMGRMIEEAAAACLEKIGLEDGECLAAIELAVLDPTNHNVWGKKALVDVLGLLGQDARDSIPTLNKLLEELSARSFPKRSGEEVLLEATRKAVESIHVEN